ncbi:DNA-binding transcriptional regulator, GntR family [Actinacidiphila yanglinensis]|uniref:DNA-binding transcriptional regulator, GntR family n=1 Tax=Actinacidiphila yanglinensis TaxID=310779 RepID=A0A1H5XIN4_9ACTN|nr:GntR family transcriptional regulator [Actinacidiphila yanglinensis]SEG11237.1 DNA-binding transcriptional regulator, GntR family [Actinacidiphila yanglinensis]
MERAAPTEPPARLPERLSVRDQVLDALRAAIVSGRLAPGTVHSAPALAERYRVSATPVREAMQLLAREGAVEVLPNRGFRIAEHTARDLAELAEVRALLEAPVVLGLTRSVPAARWERLRPLADESLVAAVGGDRAAYAEADRAFHRAVLDLSGNLHLVAVADELHRRAQWPASAAQRKGGAAGAGLVADATEHCVLLDAIASGEEAAVVDVVRRHFAAGRP